MLFPMCRAAATALVLVALVLVAAAAMGKSLLERFWRVKR
jgi:hypothetical protein